MGFWPLREKGFVGMGQFGRSAAKADPQSLLDFFKPFLRSRGWTDEQFSAVLQNAEHDFFDEVRYVKMGPWYEGRTVLLGDARHAFAPIIGQGASLALEDAYVLSEEIGRFGEGGIGQALASYAARRNGRIRRMRALSAFIEMWANVQNSALVYMRDSIGPWIPRAILVSPLKRLLQEKI